MDSKETEFITITAKNSETVEFRKSNSIQGNDAVYDENGSFSKQLSTNCGVFVFDIKENKNGELIYTDKKLLVIVTPQYGDNFLNTVKPNKNRVKSFSNELLFSNKDTGLFFKGDKSEINLTLSEISADEIEEINRLIETFNNITGCNLQKLPELNDKNKDTKITINEPITITPFAFDVAGLFEFIAREKIREKIREIINKNQLKEPDWEVFDGNLNPHNVLIEKTKKENKKEFHINGEVKPDIIIRNKKTKKDIIIDAKYKSPDKNDREDRLQILAYAYLYDAHIVGHIFPTHAKSSRDNNKKELKFHKLNTLLGDYNYVQLYLDDENLSDNIERIIEKIEKPEEICDKENEQNKIQ
ncbi:MAG: hypothetical protein ACI4HN_03815 [Ruminococcus sp.]